MSLDAALTQAMRSVPECLAIGYVDAASGMLLSIHTVDSHPQEVIDLVAAATGDLFNGPNVSVIETLFKHSREISDPSLRYFQEIIINSENLIHVFLRSKSVQDYVLVFVCRRSANLGMVLTRARAALPAAEAAL